MTTVNQYAPTNGRWTDDHGRLTTAAQVWLRELWLRTGGTAAITAGHLVQDEGVSVTQRATLNFVGSGVTVTDSGTKTTVTIPGGGGSLDDIIALEALL